MTQYLKQFIYEQQIQYREIMQHPVDVARQLFFINGGGQNIIHDDYHEHVAFGRYIPFHYYYSGERSLADLKDYYSEFIGYHEIEKEVNRQLEFHSRIQQVIPSRNIPSEDTLFDKEYNEYRLKLDNIKEIQDSDFTNSDWWYQQLLLSSQNGSCILQLSRNYIPAANLVKGKTEKYMYEWFIKVTTAYIQYYQDLLLNESISDADSRIILNDLELLGEFL